MITLGEARQHVFVRVPVGAPEPVGLADCAGLVLAADVVAAEAVPPFANTAMDGFAVRSADTSAAPVTLRVVETVAAGHPPTRPVRSGQASRIFTGAALPEGADAVVMVERTTETADGGEVTIEVAVPAGNHVRPAGDDLDEGATVFDAGTVLTAAHLGVLASLGIESVHVHPRLRVGVVSTGDELVEGPAPLRPGQIRDSNRTTLLQLVRDAGCEAIDLGIAPDDEDAITTAIDRGVSECDVVLTSGGVSMGDIDLVKVVLDRMGEMRWMQVAIKPAKPLAFGRVRGVPVFGLPGNPVSSAVSFELFARPALRRAMGHRDADRPVVRARAEAPLERRRDGKLHFARVVARFDDEGRVVVRSAGGQGSHQLAGLAAANALAVLRDGDGVATGEQVDVLLLGELWAPGTMPGG